MGCDFFGGVAGCGARLDQNLKVSKEDCIQYADASGRGMTEQKSEGLAVSGAGDVDIAKPIFAYILAFIRPYRLRDH